MSDFLGNLAARSLGLAAVVRPRVASLFEPSPTVASTAGMLDGRALGEAEGVPAARPTATIEVTDSVQVRSGSFLEQNGHEGDRGRAIARVTSHTLRRPTEGSSWRRLCASAKMSSASSRARPTTLAVRRANSLPRPSRSSPAEPSVECASPRPTIGTMTLSPAVGCTSTVRPPFSFSTLEMADAVV